MILLVGQVPRAFRGREAWQELDYARGLRRDRQGRVGGRQRDADPRARRRGVSRSRSPGGPGRSCSRCPRTCSRRRPTSRTERGSRRRRVAPARRGSRTAARARSPAPSDRSSSSGRVAGRPRRAATSRRSARRTSCRSRARSAARTSSTTARRATSASSESRWTSASRAGSATRTSCSPSAVASARCRRGATRCSSRRDPRQTLVHVHPEPSELGRVYEPDLAIAATLPEFARSRVRSIAGGAALARLDSGGARRLRGEPPARADGGRSRPGGDHGVPPRPASRRRGPDVRRRQLHGLGASLRASSRSSARRRVRARARWGTGCPRPSRRS